jgi:3D-(3,5/4)-trihydroxycyclohexane-1,2-dione acylhydrolase (decyclizing)
MATWPGIGQALHQYAGSFPYYQTRNEQAMVHTAIAYAKHEEPPADLCLRLVHRPRRHQHALGAATATINRIPVLLLPGDIFAERIQAPVLQQLEWEHSQDIGVNDCFKPVSRYWDRIYRPEQLITALPEAMRVLTSPADTGAVTLALPQDVQAMAFDYPEALFQPRVWTVPRNRPDASLLARAAEWIRGAKRPLLIAGGGVHYSEATDMLRRFVEATGIPVGETQAGKGALPYDNPANLGAIGSSGTEGANLVAREADLVIGVGTRYTDFTTASQDRLSAPRRALCQHQRGRVRRLQAGGAAAGGRRAGHSGGAGCLCWRAIGWTSDYARRVAELNRAWDAEVERIYSLEYGPPISQGEVIGVVNSLSRPEDVVLCAAGSLPGDLHKLWRTRDARGYHLEYGYSCMGYEIAGGLGVKMAARSARCTSWWAMART